jgi:hypothetical protein
MLLKITFGLDIKDKISKTEVASKPRQEEM